MVSELKTWLFFHHMTIKDLAEKIGYSRTHISKICNDPEYHPSKRLAEAIEVATDGEISARSLLKKEPK